MPLFEHAKIMMVYYTLIVSTYIFGPKLISGRVSFALG